MRRLAILLLLALSAPAATLVSKATGNFTAAGTWGVGEAGASAIQTTKSANTNTTTSYVYSSAFTCTNLDVVDGILVYGRRLGTTGTVSVALSEDNGVTATRELAINASDMDDDNSLHFFLFASTLTCDGGADYKVGVKSSTNAQATFYRDGTAGNWFRVPRTTATAAPGAGDILGIAGDLTGPGTGNSFVVTMDNTAATVFGAVAAPQSLGIGVRGDLTWGVAAATAYRLDVAGLLEVWGGGTYNQGTTGARPPTDSSLKLNFDLTTNVDSGFICENGGTCNVNGALKATIQTLLNTDEAIAATVIGVDSTSGWLAGDVICFASTTRTATESECKTILTVDSGVQVTLTAGLTNAHSGTSPAQAEVINITSNAVIQGESDTLQAFIRSEDTATSNFNRLETYRLGSATTDKRGIDAQTTTGSFSMTDSALHDFVVASSKGFFASGSSVNNITFTDNVGYNIADSFFQNALTSGTNLTVTGNVSVSTVSGGQASYHLDDVGGTTFNDNTAAGSNFVGFDFREAFSDKTITGITGHSNASSAVRWVAAPVENVVLDTWKIWRNNAQGVGTFTDSVHNLTIQNCLLFGNNGLHMDMDNAVGLAIVNCTLAGDSLFSTTRALDPNTANQVYEMRIVNSTFGVASGILTAHTAEDIRLGAATYRLIFDNSNLASATPFTTLASAAAVQSSYLKFQKYGQVAADHRSYFRYGTVLIDTTTVRASLPSQRVTPTSATVKLQSGPWNVPVASGATVAASAWVRKSTAADSCGAEYNGAEVRLIARQNSAIGITSDTTLDTSTVANGNWEQLTGTTVAATDNGTVELFVDGDGTTGCYYVESGPHWKDGLPNPSTGGGETSHVF